MDWAVADDLVLRALQRWQTISHGLLTSTASFYPQAQQRARGRTRRHFGEMVSASA